MTEEDTGAILSEKHKYIARIDQDIKKTHGWYVRVRFLDKTYSKLFSDGKYSGTKFSLHAAISWRDNLEKILGKKPEPPINSGTGVVGVRLNEKLNRYEVGWTTEQGKRIRTSVSIDKHGKKKAFFKACSIREEKAQLTNLKKS